MVATRTSIPKPDVTVTVTARTVTPTTATPALPACIIGPCYEVLDPQLSSGLTANPDAKVELPAIIRSWGNAVTTAAIANPVTVALNVNGTTVSVLFPAAPGGYTVAAIVTAFNAALLAAAASAVASVTAAEARFCLRTTTKGDGQFITWTATSVADANVSAHAFSVTALKIPRTWRSDGTSTYNQIGHVIQFDDYPDPRDIIANLTIDTTSVRLFGNLSAGLTEWFQTTTVERGGKTSIQYLDDGDGDGYTPLVQFSGAPQVRVPYDAFPLSAIDVPGLTDFVAAGTQYLTSFAAFAGGVASTLTIEVAGLEPQAIDIGGADAIADVIQKINDRFPNAAATGIADNNAGAIRFTLANLNAGMTEGVAHGRDSYIILTGTDALLIALFGGIAADWPYVGRGTWRALTVGAQLYVNGLFVGNVAEVLSANNIRLDREVAQTAAAAAADFYFVTTNTTPTMAGTATNARGNFYCAATAATDAPAGTLRIKQEILRDTTARPQRLPYMTSGSACEMYMGYTGLRLDVTPSATDAQLLSFSSATELAAEMVTDTTNPLGYGLFLAITNAPGLTTNGIGVDEVTTAEPEGTLEAYTECAEFLQSQMVYGLAPMTHSEDVAFMFQDHVDFMSTPEQKGERVLFWCPALPTRERSTIAASGAQANKTAALLVVNTGLADLPARLVAAGITLTGVPDTDMVYIQFEAYGSTMFAVASTLGSTITIMAYAGTTLPFALGTDADFIAMQAAALIDEPFTIAKIGASLYTGTVYDKTAASEAIYDLGQEFADRRVRMVIPDEVITTIGGLETAVEGYYACAALAGMQAYYSPQIGFTNLPVGGLTRVQRTQGYFTEAQLNLMAGGGAWILVPQQGGSGVTTRMSLTTDTSSVEYRQPSWTTALDYGAYYLRSVIRGIIGPSVITPELLDSVASLVDSAIKYLCSPAVRVWIDASISFIEQSTTQPDTIRVGLNVQIGYNLNYVDIEISV